MSSTRRSANEINILAMLDRHEAAGLPRRMLRRLQGMPAAVWYGAAGVLVCALVGMLAWLARDSHSSASVDTALAGAVAPRAAVAAPPATASASPEAQPHAVAEAVRVSAQPAGATIVDVVPAPERPLQPQEHAGRIVAREGQREPQRFAAHPAPIRNAPRAAGGVRPAASSHAEPRSRRPAALQKAAPEQVDTDVALISAIIQHASKRQEAEEAARKP